MASILILGAGSDIAKSIARRFAKEGFDIMLAGRKMEQLDRLKKDLISRYGSVTEVYLFDAVQFDRHEDFVRGLSRLPDIIVYSAGFMCSREEAQTDWKKAKNMIEVNYSGAVSVLNILANKFENRKGGCIIGISSVAGERGRGSNYIYGSTKAAFTAYLSGLRNQLAEYKVKVITVKPGFVRTKMTHYLSLPEKLTADPGLVADKIYRGYTNGKDVVYVKSVWRWIMLIIKCIPEPVFKRLKL